MWFIGGRLDNVIQVWLLLTVHDVLDLTVTVVKLLPGVAVGFHESGFIVNVGAAAWVTVILRETPWPDTVITPVL